MSEVLYYSKNYNKTFAALDICQPLIEGPIVVTEVQKKLVRKVKLCVLQLFEIDDIASTGIFENKNWLYVAFWKFYRVRNS